MIRKAHKRLNSSNPCILQEIYPKSMSATMHSQIFLSRCAILSWYFCLFVCLSVCLSSAGLVSKRMDMLSIFLTI